MNPNAAIVEKHKTAQTGAVGCDDLLHRSLYHVQDGIRIFCGDNRKLAPMLGEYDLLCTDPPYGIGEGNQKRILSRANAAKAIDYGHTDWDSTPPEPWMLQMAMAKARWQIIWGGNYYGLPAAKCWLVWDKENGENDFADCELAWTNLDMAVRRIKYRWAGMLQANMAEKDVRYHPTQKATSVMEWCIGKVPDAKTVLDPWMGSGTTLIAARAKGLQADGIEINEQYCAAAVARLSQGVLLAV
ncbi:MAG TPA: DNA methyltransferase [Candidatus Acidoferrum sp.]